LSSHRVDELLVNRGYIVLCTLDIMFTKCRECINSVDQGKVGACSRSTVSTRP